MFRSKAKRGPIDRAWRSSYSSKRKFSSNSAFKSWTTTSRTPAKPKPPARPSYSQVTRVCLLCLQHFNEGSIDASSDEEEIDEIIDTGDDPLIEESLNGLVKPVTPNLTVEIPKPQKPNLYLRFLTILSRHLKVKTKRFKTSATKNELKSPFCMNCTRIVKNLLKVYEEFHNAKLGLQWRLRQISDLIKCSKVSVSGKLQCTLLKSLSTQLKVVSSRAVDVFRKQVSVRCSAKLAGEGPRVSISKNSIIEAVKANWKCKIAFDQMKHYLQSLIVVFALAVPPKERPPEKKPMIGPKSKMRKVRFDDKSGVKREGGIEDKKENVPPRDVKVKREPGQGGDDPGADQDDDHFGGGDYSPPGSGPVSPVGGGEDDDERVEENGDKNPDDSDWSGGAPSANDSAGSDVEFSINSNTVRRWNLRRRRTRSKSANADDNDASDEDYTPGTLPPLRARRKIEESDLKFSCNLCNQRFTQERYLKRHLGLAHSFLMVYTCPKCPQRFKTSKELQTHRKREHRTRLGEALPYTGQPTTCNVCEKMFPSKVKMLTHRRIAHKNRTATLLKCDICGKEIRGQIRMDFHIKAHNRPDKPFRCLKCPRSFGTEEGLKVHTKIHDDNPNWVPWTRVNKRKGPVSAREGVFPCDIPGCDKTFYKKSNLVLHKSLHNTEFKCELCEFKCSLPKDYRKHLMSTHETEEKKYFCLHCDKSYTLEQTYVLHRKVVHPSKAQIPCDVDECQEMFDDTEQLRQHLKTMHLPPDVEETKENFKFHDVYNKDKMKEQEETPMSSFADAASKVLQKPDGEVKPQVTDKPDGEIKPESQVTPPENQFEDLLKINEKTNEEETEHKRLYTCARCDWSFCKKIIYSLHLILHTPRDERRLYQCELCDKAFSVVDSLQTHYNRIHGPKIKPYLCLICGTRFHRKESFIPHMRVHNDKNSSEMFECDVENCGKKFFDSINLRKHRRMVHFKNKDGTYSIECGEDECTEKFPNKLMMLNHKVDVHGMKKPYVCHVAECGKGFFNSGSLKDHMISHGDATYQCTLCPKKFKRRHNLADHYLVHKQEPQFFCEFCGRGFVKKSGLNLHLDIHRGIKKYKCDTCGKAFCRKFARDCHLRIHTGERPFACKICGKKFAQYSALKNHEKAHERLNNDKLLRRPFRKSLGVGKPLREKTDEKVETEGKTEEVEESKQEGTSYSGILHEAMKATFDDINMELEMGGVVKEDDGAHQVNSGGGNVIDAGNAVAAVGAVEQALDQIGEEKEDAPARRKRGRRPKVYKKEYSCGFCGKVFHRHDYFKRHVDKHMEEVDSSPIPSGGDASMHSQHSSLMEDHNSLQDVLQGGPEQRRSSITEPAMVTPLNVPHYTSPPPPPQLPQAPVAPPQLPQPPVAPPQVQQLRKRGRPPKQTSTPGSRLARIVEDVLETAINRPTSVTTRHHQQTHQYHTTHPSPQQHHIIQSPSPHQMPHSGSERSTPTGSPAPNNHYQQQTPVTTTPSLPFQSSAASILSPFLFTNPYLIPRMPDQQQQGSQQDPMFANFQNRQQQAPFSQHLTQQPSVNYPQQQFHQPPIHTPSQSSARTMPQDLSKNNYSMFYTNHR